MAKNLGYGTVIAYDSDGGPTWVPISQVVSIDGPNMNTERVECTTMDSAGGYREYLAGLKDAGSLSISLYYDAAEASHAWLKTTFDAATTEDFQMTLADDGDAVITFSGQVAGFSLSSTVEGVQQLDVEIQITGVVTITP